MDKELRKKYELPIEKLRYNCDPKEFKPTEKIEPGLEAIIIGQEKLFERLEKGLRIQDKYHNIFVTGPEDEEREEIIISQVRDYIRSMPKEAYTKKALERKDLVSAYNFEDPNHPTILELPTGTGELFKKDVNELTDKVLKDGMKIYEKQLKKRMENSNKKLQEIARDTQKKAEKLAVEADSLEIEMRKLKSENTKLQQNDPKIEENEKRIQELEKEVKRLDQGILQLQADYKNTATDMTRKAMNEEKLETENDKEYYLKNVVKHFIEELKKKYESNMKIMKYFDGFEKRITADVKAELDSVSNKHLNQEGQTGMISLGGLSGIAFSTPPQAQPAKDTSEYKVKLLNKLTPEETVLGIPVIFEKNPTLENLLGTIPLQEQYAISPFGTEAPKKNQHLKLKPGSFIKSIGGYMVIETMSATESLVKLIKTLDSEKTSIENVLYNQIVDKSSESIDCSNIKIIISGNNQVHQILLNYSEQGIIKFDKVFSYKVELDPVAENTPQTRKQYAEKIAQLCKKEDLKEVKPEGLAEIIEHSTRLTDSQDKLIAIKFSPIKNLIREANAEAGDSKYITAEHIQKAIEAKKNRHNLIEKKYQEFIDKDIFVVNTSGEAIGELNGLAVITRADIRFGKPSRITAGSLTRGKEGIKDVHTKVKLSGEIKEMGEEILNGFVKERYFNPLSEYDTGDELNFNCLLLHEQSYNMIDGDSASSTGLYVALSKLGEFPLDQGIAVTGRVSQKGEVQAIGGVNEKIEGFYTTCKEKGLTDSQGVMIPKINEKDLMLSEEVIDSIKKGKFHIYSVSNLKEGFEILSGLLMDEIDKKVVTNLKKFTPKDKKE